MLLVMWSQRETDEQDPILMQSPVKPQRQGNLEETGKVASQMGGSEVRSRQGSSGSPELDLCSHHGEPCGKGGSLVVSPHLWQGKHEP